MELKELNWEKYRKQYGNIHRVDRILKSEGLSPDGYKAAKQADVLMLFYVLNEEEIKVIFKRLGYFYPKDLMKKNFDYYEPRTSHGSTLSRVVHSFVAERIGYETMARDFYMQALRSDVNDVQGGTTQEGIHGGVMGGTIDLFLRNFAGLSIKDDRLCFDPKLPKKWRKARFRVRYKNILYDVVLATKKISILASPFKESAFLSAKGITVKVRRKDYKILPGKSFTAKL